MTTPASLDACHAKEHRATDDTSLLLVTHTAVERILADAQRSDARGMALRVAARQEADGSIAYGMGFDDVAADDEPMQFGALTVVAAAGCEPLLQGAVLDFIEIGPGVFHFVFIPPPAEAPEPAPVRGCSGGCSGCGGA